MGRCLVYGGTLALIAAIAVPNVLEHRCGDCGTAAIGGLKTIDVAQSLFREADKEEDGNLDYATLAELGESGPGMLIDSVLASGTKHSYLHEVTYGSQTSEFLWFATARPQTPGAHGHRYFCTNHEGVIFYTMDRPFRLNAADCTIPAGVPRVGR